MRRAASRNRRRPEDERAEEPAAGHPILELQAAAGNQAVAALLRQPVKEAKATEHEQRARALAKRLEKDRAGVIEEVRKLSEADRKSLDEAAKVLSKAQAALLRRIIEFVDSPPPTEKHETPVKQHKATKEEFAEDLEGGGKVTAQSGVRFYGADGNLYTDAFSLSYSGGDADKVHWLQFIWREIVAEYPAKQGAKARREAIKGKWKRPSSEYELTTDPAKPNWNVDVVRAGSPFYEHNQPLNRSPSAVTMFDPPSPGHDVAQPLFERDERPAMVVSQAHFMTYLVRGMDIVHATQIDLRWEFTDEKKVPPLKPPVMKAVGVRKLESAHRARLKEQFPSSSLDYLP